MIKICDLQYFLIFTVPIFNKHSNKKEPNTQLLLS